jgi:hypothetical protein
LILCKIIEESDERMFVAILDTCPMLMPNLALSVVKKVYSTAAPLKIRSQFPELESGICIIKILNPKEKGKPN